MCDKCLLPVPLDSRNFVETLCDSWVLSTSVCGTGIFAKVFYEITENSKVPTNT